MTSRVDSSTKRIAELATSQHGIVTREQLRACGISGTTISRWIASGRLHRIHPGVYTVGHGAPSRMGLMLAALLSSGDRAAIARRTALEIWGVWRTTERDIDIVVTARTRMRHGVNVHHSRQLPDSHTRTVRGIRVTSPSRTLLDLALDLDAKQVANVIHEMTFRKLFERESVVRCARDLSGSAAVPVILAALEMERIGSAGTKSELERRVLALLLELGLQLPVSNVHVRTAIGHVELDNCWPSARIYLEVDGPPHARQRTKNADRDKRIALRAKGWVEVRIGYLELDLDRAGVSRRLLAKLPRVDSVPAS